MAIITTINNQYDFEKECNKYGSYKDNFSRLGKFALFDYLANLSEDTGEDFELDYIALCCEFSEYDSALKAVEDYTQLEDREAMYIDCEKVALEYLQDSTQVITFDGGVIVQSF